MKSPPILQGRHAGMVPVSTRIPIQGWKSLHKTTTLTHQVLRRNSEMQARVWDVFIQRVWGRGGAGWSLCARDRLPSARHPEGTLACDVRVTDSVWRKVFCAEQTLSFNPDTLGVFLYIINFWNHEHTIYHTVFCTICMLCVSPT